MLGCPTLAFANERRAGEQDRDHRDLVDQRYDSAERAPGQSSGYNAPAPQYPPAVGIRFVVPLSWTFSF